MPLRHLVSLADLDAVLADSANRPVMLFKHSTRCPVSSSAQSAYLSWVAGLPADSKLLCTHLDLIAHRDVSNAIAQRLDVPHESPQAILVVQGKAVWDESHYGIAANTLDAALADHT